MNRIGFILIFVLMSVLGVSQNDKNNNSRFVRVEGKLSGQWISDIMQDANGYIWIGTQDGLYKNNGKSFSDYRYNPEDKNTIQANWIRYIHQDDEGLFWIATHGGGLISYDENKGSFNKITTDNATSNFNPSIVYSVFVTKSQDVWANTDEGLYRKSHQEPTFELHETQSSNFQVFQLQNLKEIVLKNETLYRFHPENNRFELLLKDAGIGTILEANNNSIIYESQGRLFSFDYKNPPESIELPNHDEVLHVSNVQNNNSILIAKNGNYSFDIKTKSFNRFDYDMSEFKQIGISKLFIDQQNLLWVATHKGLYRQNILAEVFKNQIDFHARRIVVDEQNIFVGGGKGLYRIPKTNLVDKKLLKDINVTAICKTANGIFTASHSGGLYFIDKNDEVSEVDFRNETHNPNRIFGIVEDQQERIWVSSWEGLYVFDETGQFLKKYSVGNTEETKVIKLLMDTQDNLWAITVGDGMYKIPNISKTNMTSEKLPFVRYITDETDKNSINSNVVMDIHLSPEGVIWIGSDFGVNTYKKATDSFSALRINGALFDKKIMAIETDTKGLLWISTINDGIFVYNNEANEIFNFKEEDGLSSNACLYTSSAVFNNELYFGTDEGVQIINTEHFTYPKVDEAPTFVNLKIQNEDARVMTDVSLKNQPLDINHDQTNFSVSFAITDYRFPQKLNFYYKFDDNSVKWTKAEGHKVDFNKINNGDYTLLVKAAYQAEDSSPIASLRFTIHPPWYQSMLAYVLYAIVFGLIIFSFFLLRYRQKLAATKLKAVEELDAFKSNLFTNITHELRTPLTLISGPIEQQLANKDLDEKDRAELNMVKQNADRLLNLVNQMLDLAMLDSGQIKLQVSKGNLGLLLEQIVAAFQYIADKKNIQIKSKIKNLNNAWFDADNIEKIVSNLLTNAIKYAPEDSEVLVNAAKQADNLVLTIINNDKSVGDKNLAKLFQRFYQDSASAEGIGVGLSLVKELVVLSKGNIIANKFETDKIQFTVSIPIDSETLDTNESPSEVEIIDVKVDRPSEGLITNSEISTLLIVEDNIQISELIESIFQDSFQIIKADNGKTGVTLALKEVPDIIISDVMMPLMSGTELCDTLKNDEITSHIPIILLTAKVGHKHEMEGLTSGADAYITKPFSSEKLKLRVQKLLEGRRALQKHYGKDFKINPAIAITSTETEFLNRLQEALNSHLTNPEFTSDYFVKVMQMSRTQLHRKLKAIVGMTASEFIRTERMKLAIPLLQNSDATVAEIAFQVGFNSPSYFTKCFRETYKCTPNEFALK